VEFFEKRSASAALLDAIDARAGSPARRALP